MRPATRPLPPRRPKSLSVSWRSSSPAPRPARIRWKNAPPATTLYCIIGSAERLRSGFVTHEVRLAFRPFGPENPIIAHGRPLEPEGRARRGGLARVLRRGGPAVAVFEQDPVPILTGNP